jgi:hypothetical protein
VLLTYFFNSIKKKVFLTCLKDTCYSYMHYKKWIKLLLQFPGDSFIAGECPKWNKPPNNSIIDNIDKENKKKIMD